MNNRQILEIAMRQSACDSSCSAEDFLRFGNKVVISKASPMARKYLELPFLCDLTSYGNNIVASVSAELEEIVRSYISKYPVEHCFETPNLHAFMDVLRPFGCSVCFMAEYFLPDVDIISRQKCEFTTRILFKEDFSGLYLPEWSNALCDKRRQNDILAVGAFDGRRLIGLAGCSADCDSMWQIGVDVLPEYRRRGIAAALTTQLAVECLSREIVPFYCSAWSNLKSVRTAIKSGFRPGWVQLTVKSDEFISEMNRTHS